MSCTAVIVQARMASTRLPGKVLEVLSGRTVLRHVLERCGQIHGAEVVCCAVPDGHTNDPVAEEAKRCGVEVYRGSETDVLARYAGASRSVGADTVMRVTSDCPLIDPDVCRRVLALVKGGGVDYACNNMPSGWPHGLDCEAFSTSVLYEAEAQANLPFEREHVTPWLRNSTKLVRANLIGPGGWPAEQRWTLDYQEDFHFFTAVFAALEADRARPDTDSVLALLRRRPDIAAINAIHRNASRPTSNILQEAS